MWRNMILILAAVAFTFTTAHAGDKEAWLHVKVEERNGDEETVRINLPLNLVESLLPLIDAEGLERGHLSIDCEELEDIDMKEVVKQLKDAPDAEYVTVESDDENVHIRKKDGFLEIKVESRHDNVKIKVPFEVATSIFNSDRGDEIDLIALVQTLKKYRNTDLVTVEEDDTTVRIWIDEDCDSN
jgi:hypothetical protein